MSQDSSVNGAPIALAESIKIEIVLGAEMPKVPLKTQDIVRKSIAVRGTSWHTLIR